MRLTPFQLLELVQQRLAEAKVRQRSVRQSFGPTVTEDVVFSIEEAGEMAQTISEMHAQGVVLPDWPVGT